MSADTVAQNMQRAFCVELVLQCVAVHYSVLQCRGVRLLTRRPCVTVCCSVLQCVAASQGAPFESVT